MKYAVFCLAILFLSGCSATTTSMSEKCAAESQSNPDANECVYAQRVAAASSSFLAQAGALATLGR